MGHGRLKRDQSVRTLQPFSLGGWCKMGNGRNERLANHPSEETLAAFAVGKLVESQLVIVGRHIESCDRCAALVSDSPEDAFVDRLRASHHSRTGQPARGEPNAAQGTKFNLDQLPAELHNHPRYEVSRLIAEGGMSWVYLARHRVTHALVALKTIKPELAANRELVGRFLREARLAGQHSHPHVARVYDAEQLGQVVYIAMEYVTGQTLEKMVAERGPLSIADACLYAGQVARGLQHASEHGVVHRDVKPQNIIVDEATRAARLVDFGLGRVCDENRSRFRLTRDDQVLGTPDYMAPEQAQDARTADARADIYSLGCTLYFLLAGRPPFLASSILDLLTRHETEIPQRITSFRRDVPRVVDECIERMLSKDPADRPQTAAEVADTLLEYSKPRSSWRPNPAWWGQWRRLARAAWTPAFVLPILTAILCLVLLLGL